MISFCQWVQHNYISYFGVIGEPLQMLSLAHLFIQLASGGAKGHWKKCYVNVEKQYVAASQTYGNSMPLLL